MLPTPLSQSAKRLPRAPASFYNAPSARSGPNGGIFRTSNERGKGVQITVNGKAREVAEGTSIAALLKQLELPPPQVAVEVNLQLVPRARHAEHRLAAGDRLEVVTLVGGG